MSRKTDTREGIRTVTANTFIMACGLDKLTLKARKLLYVAVSQCKQSDQEFFEYEIDVKDFAYLMGIDASNVYKVADKLTDELFKGFIRVEDENGWRKYALFSRCDYNTGNHSIYFKLNPDMTTFLLDLKRSFSQPLLSDFLKMRSPYSIEIWHLMQREMHSTKPSLTSTITFDLSLTELRKVTGTEHKLKQISEFKGRVLDKAIREIWDNCGVELRYTNIKIGREVVGFRFEATSIFHVSKKEMEKGRKFL